MVKVDWQILCSLGLHKWSENRFGVRICLRCPAVDRYYGLTGLLRYRQEKIEREDRKQLLVEAIEAIVRGAQRRRTCPVSQNMRKLENALVVV